MNTNNSGGSDSPLSYRPTYYYGESSGESDDGDKNIVPLVFVIFAIIILLLRPLWSCRWSSGTETELEAGGGDRLRQPLPPLWSNDEEDGGVVVNRAPSSAVAGVEVTPVRAAEPPLECTYLKADGWGESSCGVCLADLADGEAIRVLPACMHYFHAACVNEWLRVHATCPLCRAPLLAAADAT